MKLPQPVWAVVLACLGVGLAMACLFHPVPDNKDILNIASNLVSGALGAFAGHTLTTSTKGEP